MRVALERSRSWSWRWEDTGSYTNLYDLNRVGGHWLVSRVAALDDATTARLAAAPPASD